MVDSTLCKSILDDITKNEINTSNIFGYSTTYYASLPCIRLNNKVVSATTHLFNSKPPEILTIMKKPKLAKLEFYTAYEFYNAINTFQFAINEKTTNEIEISILDKCKYLMKKQTYNFPLLALTFLTNRRPRNYKLIKKYINVALEYDSIVAYQFIYFESSKNFSSIYYNKSCKKRTAKYLLMNNEFCINDIFYVGKTHSIMLETTYSILHNKMWDVCDNFILPNGMETDDIYVMNYLYYSAEMFPNPDKLLYIIKYFTICNWVYYDDTIYKIFDLTHDDVNIYKIFDSIHDEVKIFYKSYALYFLTNCKKIYELRKNRSFLENINSKNIFLNNNLVHYIILHTTEIIKLRVLTLTLGFTKQKKRNLPEELYIFIFNEFIEENTYNKIKTLGLKK